MSFTLALIIVGALLALTAFLCAVETALLACSKARMHQLSREGDLRANIVLDLNKQIDEVLVAILIILTLVPVASSALITSATLATFGPQAVIYSTAALGIVLIFVAEAFPKAVGTRFPNGIALAWARPLAWFMKLMLPITWGIKKLSDGILNLLGLHAGNANLFTEADLRGAINLGLEHGTLAPTQSRMLDAILDLNELTVADVMIHRSAIRGLDVNTQPSQLPASLAELRHSRITVYENEPENLLGILYVRDYLTALASVENRQMVRLRDHLRPLYFVPETTPIGHQLLEFLRLHRHLALVVDEYGDLQGLITLEDIMEEIVGDISDEHEAHQLSTAPHVMPSGTALLLGRTTVRSANRDFKWNLPEESAVTLAGLMVESLGRLPSQGESVTIGNLTLTVTHKRGHRVERIQVETHEPQA